jgi:hypothetical protein
MILKGGDFDLKPVGTGIDSSYLCGIGPQNEKGLSPLAQQLYPCFTFSSALPALPADARTAN